MPHMSKFCQNGTCKKLASVQVMSPIPDVEKKDGTDIQVTQRRLNLCPEDAAYFLEIRDEDKRGPINPRTEKFVASCHRN